MADNVFCLSDLSIHQTSLHTRDGFFCKDAVRFLDLNLRKFCCILPECLCGNTDSRGCDTGYERSGCIYKVISGGCTEIKYEHRTAINLISCRSVHDTVCTDLTWIFCDDTDSRFCSRLDHDWTDV